MAKTKKKISKIKTKKKIWFKIFAPKLFGQKEMGESYLSAADQAIGRKLKVNMKELTGNVRDQNVSINFKINKVDGSSLRTEVIGYQLSTAYIKRSVRKNTDRVDNTFKLKTKSGKDVILKSLIVTRNKGQRSVRTALKNKLEEFLKEELSKSDFTSFIEKLIAYRIQSTAKKQLSKICPLKEVAIRSLSSVNEKKKPSIKVEEPSEEVEEELSVEKTESTEDSSEELEENVSEEPTEEVEEEPSVEKTESTEDSSEELKENVSEEATEETEELKEE